MIQFFIRINLKTIYYSLMVDLSDIVNLKIVGAYFYE